MRVILTKVASFGAICATTLLLVSPYPSHAQSAARLAGPAELPPAGFTGQQYVDSRGCVFMRAGLGGQVNWVPRIGADRKPICAQVTPQQAAQRLEEAAPPAPKAKINAPLATIASNMKTGPSTGVVAPMPVPGLSGTGIGAVAVQPTAPQPLPPQPAAQTMAAKVAPSAAASTGCPASAPKLEYLPLTTGGSVAVCTRGDGTATGWVSPNYAQTARLGPALRSSAQSSGQTTIAPQIAAPSIPKGYQAAWPDDRLNPNRALGTAQGNQSQAQIWTNTVPAKLAAPSSPPIAQANLPQPAPTASAAGGLFVQVGTFGQPSNAQNAAARLSGMGLPVATSQGMRGGRKLVAVLAGPFSTEQDARLALSSLRGAGFSDAFLR
jgi:hypothetical protein